MKIFDLCTPEERNEKTFWSKIGTLFQGDDGKMWLKLSMFPGLKVQVFEQRPRDGQAPSDGQRYGKSGHGNSAKHTAGDDDGGSFPF